MFDRTLNAAFGVYVKTEKLDAAAYAKYLKETAQDIVDKNPDGVHYLIV